MEYQDAGEIQPDRPSLWPPPPPLRTRRCGSRPLKLDAVIKVTCDRPYINRERERERARCVQYNIMINISLHR